MAASGQASASTGSSSAASGRSRTGVRSTVGPVHGRDVALVPAGTRRMRCVPWPLRRTRSRPGRRGWRRSGTGRWSDERNCTFGFGMLQVGFVAGCARRRPPPRTCCSARSSLDHPGRLAMGIAAGRRGRGHCPMERLVDPVRSVDRRPLALGNTVVLKPLEVSPVVGGVLWARSSRRPDCQRGSLHVVTHAPGEAARSAMSSSRTPPCAGSSLTGSTATGRRFAEAAGQHLKRVVLRARRPEPADRPRGRRPRLRRRRSTFGAFVHQGQICMSRSTHLRRAGR